MAGPGRRRRPVVPVGLLALLALVAVTAVWGSTFFMLKGVVTRIPAADFLAVRFWIAALVLWAMRPGSVARLGREGRRRGLWLGVAYGSGQLVQTWGLEHTSASVSGFVTGMYVVITPLLAALLLRQRIQGSVRIAVALATTGLAVLSLHGFAMGGGEALTLVAAGLYALHIIGLGAWSRGRDAYGLTVVQMVATASVCSLAALPGGVVLPHRGDDWAVLLYMALASGAAAVLLQTWAQSHLPPTRAAIVMTMEPVWAGGFAVTLGAEPIGGRLLVGGALTLAAMFLAELGPRARASP
jgi:drug/metabolite transporter (DMT)-like permease